MTALHNRIVNDQNMAWSILTIPVQFTCQQYLVNATLIYLNILILLGTNQSTSNPLLVEQERPLHWL